jgi:hypothetical protein
MIWGTASQAFAVSEPPVESPLSSPQPSPTLSQNIELVDHIGSPGSIEVRGDYAYIIVGSELVIKDISDPANPRRVGRIFMPNLIDNMYLSGQYAYLTVDNQGLKLINISNPTAPIEVGSYTTSLDNYDVVVVGNYAYLGTEYWPGQLVLLDVSNPSVPVEVASFTLRASHIEVNDHYLYYIHWSRGLVVLDISNPTTPVELGSTGPLGVPSGIVIEGSYVYVLGSDGGIAIIDVSDPAHPKRVGTIPTEYGVRNIAIIDDYAYVPVRPSNEEQHGLHIVDISNPTAPAEILIYDLPAPVYIAASAPYLYITDAMNNLNVVDISNPQAPSTASFGTGGTASYIQKIARIGQDHLYLYPDYDYGDMRVVDISNRATPIVINLVPNWGGELDVVGNYAYLASGSLRIFDISNPVTPTLLGSLIITTSTPLNVYDVAVRDSYAYLPDGGYCDREGCYDQRLWVVDVSDPVSPTIVSFHEGMHGNAEIVGDYLYLGGEIMDLSDPVHPVGVGWSPGQNIVAGNLLFYTTGTAINIVDVSNSAAPKPLGSYSTPTSESTGELAADGNRLYAATVSGGQYHKLWKMVAIDITDPTMPIGLGIYTMPRAGAIGIGISELAGAGDYVYTVGTDGLFALRYTGGTLVNNTSYLPLMHVNR